MSYSTWHDYGYGVCVDDLKEEISLVKLMELIRLAPKLHEKIKRYIDDECNGQIMDASTILRDYVEEHGEIEYGGLAEILYEIIKEAEGIELYVCTDFNNAEYLIYPPIYPWELRNMSEKVQKLTEDNLRELYRKYLHIVTDEEITIDYKSVENGG